MARRSPRRPQPLRSLAQRGRALAKLLRAAWREYEGDYAAYFAAGMAYYLLASLVPLLLLVLATLGLLLRVSAMAAAAEQHLLRAVQNSFGADLRATIDELLEHLQEESGIAMVISMIGLLITASSVLRHLRLGFRAIWKHDPPPPSGSVLGMLHETVREHATAFFVLLTAGALLTLTLGFIAVVHWLSGLVGGLPRFSDTTGWLVALPLSFVLATVTFALLFKFIPPVSVGWRHVWVASLLCGIAWIAGADLLALYATFGDSSPYGAIGGLFVVMLWMKFVSQVLFYGAEVCKVSASASATERR